ncbi:glycosyltransferase family 4 protein [uncultured Pedobacter sp.]|uniref:glycosyltransferase family 4 protein n=1 Tax=uncultured Pedobacter sp. TaxID=246139 RepID=UPI0025EC3447|nr:glycosyltransferase family 4 protein [uncultured Pedobacter sp.]
MKRILFITQNLGRGGSEMLLWYSLNHLNKNKFTPIIFCKEKGELIDALPTQVKYFLPYKKSRKFFQKAFRAILKCFRINPLEYQLKRIQERNNIDFWYVNTIIIPEVYEIAQKLGVKIITHVHELTIAYNFITYSDLKRIINYSSILIGCSEAVCNKIRDMGRTDVKLLYGFVDTDKITYTKLAQEVKAATGFSSDDFVWAISGKTSLIKGIDFLVALLEVVPQNFKFIWIGGDEFTGLYYYTEKSLQTKFPGRVKFLGIQRDEYYNYLNSADAFLLLSREDSFPLVMLEAATLGKPIVGFNSGGISEFIKPDTGRVINSWRIEDLADSMKEIESNFSAFKKEEIKRQVLNYEVKKQVAILEDILDEMP